MEIVYGDTPATVGGLSVAVTADCGFTARELVYRELDADGAWRVNSSPNKFPSFNRALECAVAKARSEAGRANAADGVVKAFIKDVAATGLANDAVGQHLDFIRERARAAEQAQARDWGRSPESEIAVTRSERDKRLEKTKSAMRVLFDCAEAWAEAQATAGMSYRVPEGTAGMDALESLLAIKRDEYKRCPLDATADEIEAIEDLLWGKSGFPDEPSAVQEAVNND